ncbi:LLM class flavin-dependent oxidoreductase [Paraburkholderia aspalathi]|nr:LLM class flavin-dependent oxidoreductase [Paraburkholderia aspalathi]
MELGLYTFADMGPDPQTGRMMLPAERMKNLIEEIELADQVGLDVFGVGEHHRPEYAVSAPAIALAAAATRTKNIRLTSAVTVLSSDDPVRVFQQFSTLDLISNGRAEIMAGRGSFIESFPLFGYNLEDYDTLFSEKLDLLLAIRDNEHLTWSGTKHPPINGRGVYPRPLQEQLPVWIAVGGTPASVGRAALLGLPLAIAIIGGEPEHFAPLTDFYRETAAKAGHAPDRLKIGINSHGFVGEDSQSAADDFFPSYAYVMSQLGRERGWAPTSRAQFEAMRGPRGSLLVGSPQQVIDKILTEHSYFKNDRFLMQSGLGNLPHLSLMKSIELFGTKVAPEVRKALKTS